MSKLTLAFINEYTVKSKKPIAINGNGGTPLLSNIPMIGMAITPNNVGAKSVTPVSYGVNPKTRCAKIGYTNTDVKRPKPATKVKMVVTPKFLFPKSLIFTAGCLMRNSCHINSPILRDAMSAQNRMDSLLNQSSVSPRSNTYCKQLTPAINNPIPTKSILICSFLVPSPAFSSIKIRESVVAITPIGMFTKNINGQLKCSII